MIGRPLVLQIDMGDGLARKSLAEQVYELLERAVVQGQIPPGTRLSEEAIGAAFAVSRSPAREAIAELELKGLAERLPNRERRVTVPSEIFIRDTYGVWILLESEGLFMASTVAEPELVASLEEQVDRIEALTPRGSAAEISAAVTAFHTDLQRGCPNKQLHRITGDWNLYIRWLRRLYFDYDAEATERGISDHRSIVECFKQRSRPKLFKAMRKHVEWQRDLVLEGWRKSNAAWLVETGGMLEFRLTGRADIPVGPLG